MNKSEQSVLIFVFFLFLNFAALAIGGYFTGSEVKGEWYLSLNKAPWTPPGWVFGTAWTSIMVCFSFYMTSLFIYSTKKTSIIWIYILQWILNVIWNPVFFYFHHVTLALIIICGLTVLVIYMLLSNRKQMRFRSFLIAPYFLWMLIATSLNLYIVFMN